MVLSAFAIVQSREMYSDPSLLHIHRLKVHGVTLLIWPTFGLCAIALGLVTLGVLYMAWTTAQQRQIEAHKVRQRLDCGADFAGVGHHADLGSSGHRDRR